MVKPFQGPAAGFFVLFLLLLSCGIHAQDAVADEQAIVINVRYVGNEPFTELQLSPRVRTRANRQFLGIPGARWWHWLYRVGESGKVGNRLGRAFMASGEPPATLDSTVILADVERIRLFYEQEGYRQAQVRARIDRTPDGDKAVVTFLIDKGRPTFLRRVQYEGLGHLEPVQREEVIRRSGLKPVNPIVGDSLGFQSGVGRFSEPALVEERRRLLNLLRDAGYASVTRDSIRAIVYQGPPDSLDVVFTVHPGPRYRFGDVRAQVVGPETGAAVRHDTLLTADHGLAITATITDDRRLDPDLIRRSLRFKPGEWYHQSRVQDSKRHLDAAGVFSFSNIMPDPADTMVVGGVPYLAHRIELRTRRRHQIRIESFMLQRSGVFTGSDTELGAGAGVSYENNNWLGKGETFQLRTTGSVAADIVSDTSLSAQAEIAANLGYPYLWGPFKGLDRLLNLYDARTRVTLSLLTARRDELRLIIRGRGNARLRLEMFHSPTVASLVDLPDISVSNPDTLAGFSGIFLDNVSEGLDPVQQARLLEDYTRPQINSAFRYTLRSAELNPLRRDRGYSYEGSFEVGGNLPYLLDRYVYSPDSLEGSLPGLPFFAGRGTAGRLVYRQYLRFVVDLRRYKPTSTRSVLAYKAYVGVGHPLGRADVIPFERRFYSGGATSVRGWGLRELGPGSASFTGTGGGDRLTTNILGGDIKLEAGVESRNTLLRNVLAADWIAAGFIDAGNVWFGPRNPGNPDGRFRFRDAYREIGVGTGLGLRLAWEYLIVRLDFAWKVYDPARRNDGLFPESWRTPAVHFGIGHAF